ncbi:MAG: glycosyltransferase family 2 protein [Terricaulis sp.]
MQAETATALLIAAYNAEATIERAILSALAQPEVAEVCVIDDASSDRTADVARACAARDPRVIVRVQAKNAGPAAARNVGLAATRSPWIGILDADDYLLEGRIEKVLAHAGEGDFIADALLRVADGAAPERAAAAWRGASRQIGFTEFVLGNLGQSDGPLDLGFIKPLMRRSFLEAHAIQYRDPMRLGEDYELYARALAHGARLLLTPPAGYVSVEREGSLSKKHSETDLLHLRDCDAELASIPGLGAQQKRALARHWTSVDNRLQWRRLISAVKARDIRAALATFHTLSAACFLTARLLEQAWLRGRALLTRAPSHSNAPAMLPQTRP